MKKRICLWDIDQFTPGSSDLLHQTFFTVNIFFPSSPWLRLLQINQMFLHIPLLARLFTSILIRLSPCLSLPLCPVPLFPLSQPTLHHSGSLFFLKTSRRTWKERRETGAGVTLWGNRGCCCRSFASLVAADLTVIHPEEAGLTSHWPGLESTRAAWYRTTIVSPAHMGATNHNCCLTEVRNDWKLEVKWTQTMFT